MSFSIALRVSLRKDKNSLLFYAMIHLKSEKSIKTNRVGVNDISFYLRDFYTLIKVPLFYDMHGVQCHLN
jgi:hypothetical protein